MHYYIDGYNLLFRMVGPLIDDLKSARELLIYSLNQKASELGLDVTIVFDSQYLPGEGSRGHYKHLEICFTATGMTADEFILQALNFCSNPRQVMVITSDRDLAVKVRHFSAGTQSVEPFIHWLNKRYKNKCKESKQKFVPKLNLMKTVPDLQPSSPTTQKPRPPPAEGSEEYYLIQFEEKLKNLPPLKLKSKKKFIKKSKGVPSEISEDDLKLSEEERWLKIFQERMKEFN